MYTGNTITVGEYDSVKGLPFADDTRLQQIRIYGDLYREIEEAVANWSAETTKAASDPTGYSGGFTENPSLFGAIGEVAVATILYNEDNNVMTVGKPDDGWDYVYQDETYDVKTTELNWSIWINASDWKPGIGRIEYPIKADWYVAVHQDARHIHKGWMDVTVLGRVHRDVVEQLPVVEGKRPDPPRTAHHHVRKITFDLLEPMPTPPEGWETS